VRIARALISVSDKSGIEEFARRLAHLGIELFSTGGTARLLRDAGVPVRDVAELTGWPEMLSGRVKTLHPKVHGGILFRRSDAEHRRQVAEHSVAPIDLVVVNLYPFAAIAQRQDTQAEELIENIDIGGPAMVRSAAKNFEEVIVATDPADYASLAAELESRGDISRAARLELARKAFALTSRYDGLIAMELERLSTDGDGWSVARAAALPRRLLLAWEQRQAMRYGENPHQQAALYVPEGEPVSGLARARQLQGKELSYNNLADLDAAWQLAREFERPCAVIIKHNNPCGVAEQESLVEAYCAALASDPTSAFGGILAFNRLLDAATAAEVAKLFVECVLAPGFAQGALEQLRPKKNLRLLEMPAAELPRHLGSAADAASVLELKKISGGLLAQTPDEQKLDARELKVGSRRAPTQQEMADLLFAWKVAKHTKSNAIVFARDGRTLGIGAGQMSRVDSVRLAVMKAQSPLTASAVASDAFFPFPDGVIEAANAGASAVIQPGGSVRDAEVIAAADARNLAMVLTAIRHFKH
jgi:phosphoribosylaminoimidazolecarboxamide formyltransferase / IMP cyclohydrolase